MEPDQDLLDKLDRREGPRWFLAIVGVAGLAALVGLVTCFTLETELRTSSAIAVDAAISMFVGSAALLGIGFFKFS